MSSFQLLVRLYPEEWGRLIRGIGRLGPRRGADYSEEGAYLANPAFRCRLQPSYPEQWGVPSDVFRDVLCSTSFHDRPFE